MDFSQAKSIPGNYDPLFKTYNIPPIPTNYAPYLVPGNYDPLFKTYNIPPMKYMFANIPKVAKRWAKKYGTIIKKGKKK